MVSNILIIKVWKGTLAFNRSQSFWFFVSFVSFFLCLMFAFCVVFRHTDGFGFVYQYSYGQIGCVSA